MKDFVRILALLPSFWPGVVSGESKAGRPDSGRKGRVKGNSPPASELLKKNDNSTKSSQSRNTTNVLKAGNSSSLSAEEDLVDYLDSKGTVTSFSLVPWDVLHTWLSELSGNPHVGNTLAKGVSRFHILEELETRRKTKQPNSNEEEEFTEQAQELFGYGRDWREYENPQGYTHLEEILIYQPRAWKQQAREYLMRFRVDLDRVSENRANRTIQVDLGKDEQPLSLFLSTPILGVLLHPELERTARYEPLNLLLAYGVRDPRPLLTKDLKESQRSLLLQHLSPLDWFLEFSNHVSGYKLDLLRKVGHENSFPRLCLIKELDFSNIVGQRLAKQLIRQAVVNHIWNRSTKKSRHHRTNRQPLSMIFAGPSGNGKTELALHLGELLNKQEDDFFIKVDCGKLSDANEMFGMSGAYQGATEGSALNNFVLRMSKKPTALGIVLLDEIEKSSQDIIHGLYQVIDKGEWTNKRLVEGRAQTETIPCHNLIFIMTTNACDSEINSFAESSDNVYIADEDDFHEVGDDLCTLIRNKLRAFYPFTDAFVGRIGRIVPFLPMADGDPDMQHALLGEMVAVAKVLIEQQQTKYALSETANVHQLVSAKTKHRMAKIMVKEAIRDAGVRSIQKSVEAKMGDRMVHALLLEKGGIQQGSEVDYFAREEDPRIDFRLNKQQQVDDEDTGYESDNGDDTDADNSNDKEGAAPNRVFEEDTLCPN